MNEGHFISWWSLYSIFQSSDESNDKTASGGKIIFKKQLLSSSWDIFLSLQKSGFYEFFSQNLCNNVNHESIISISSRDIVFFLRLL